jgi:ankyrin repeat protein
MWTLGSDSQFGYTLPMWAVQQKDMTSLSMLLAGGADVRAKDTLGMTAMDLAKQLNHAEACALLQQALDQAPPIDDP